jgi:hypothetical protein
MGSMEDVSEEFARRDRVRRYLAQKKTPEQRMEEMARRQAQAWEILRNSPEGYARFLRRNFRARAIQVSDDLQG